MSLITVQQVPTPGAFSYMSNENHGLFERQDNYGDSLTIAIVQASWLALDVSCTSCWVCAPIYSFSFSCVLQTFSASYWTAYTILIGPSVTLMTISYSQVHSRRPFVTAAKWPRFGPCVDDGKRKGHSETVYRA